MSALALFEEKQVRRRQEWLARGDDPLARWWRSLAGASRVKPVSAVVREEPESYEAPGKEAVP
jgi:hypothetical protein